MKPGIHIQEKLTVILLPEYRSDVGCFLVLWSFKLSVVKQTNNEFGSPAKMTRSLRNMQWESNDEFWIPACAENLCENDWKMEKQDKWSVVALR